MSACHVLVAPEYDVKWELVIRFYPSLEATMDKYQRFIEQNPPEEIWYEGELPF